MVAGGAVLGWLSLKHPSHFRRTRNVLLLLLIQPDSWHGSCTVFANESKDDETSVYSFYLVWSSKDDIWIVVSRSFGATLLISRKNDLPKHVFKGIVQRILTGVNTMLK